MGPLRDIEDAFHELRRRGRARRETRKSRDVLRSYGPSNVANPEATNFTLILCRRPEMSSTRSDRRTRAEA
jgi:hypothetical protein